MATRILAQAAGPADLAGDIVVVPTARAKRDLEAHLAHLGGAELPSPTIVTATELPGLLLVLASPLPSALQRRLAVACALRRAPRSVLTALLHESALPRDDAARFLLAGGIARTLQEIASFARTTEDVARAAELLPGLSSVGRWRALVEVERLQIEALSASGLSHEGTALESARQTGDYVRPRRVTFVGTPDVPPALVALVVATGAPTTVFVQADAVHAARFDAHGIFLPDAWETAVIALPDERLLFADGPREQAEIAAQVAAEVAQSRPERTVIVGSTDPGDHPALVGRFVAAGMILRNAGGRAVASSLPAAALAAARDLLAEGTVASLSAFVRHPDIERALGKRGAPFAADLLDGGLSRSPSRAAATALDRTEPLLQAAVQALLEPLVERGKGGIPRFLGSLFGGAPSASTEARAVGALVEIAKGIAEAPLGLRISAGPGGALSVVLAALEDASVPGAADDRALDLVGFLELPLAEADVLIVTGVAAGRWPAAPPEDPLLPEPLRRAAGLHDARRSLARDAHAFLVVTGGHREAIVVAPLATSGGDALGVSRLVLGGPPAVAARRLLAAYRRPAPKPSRARAGVTVSGFRVPHLPPLDPRPTRFAVTAFRDFLACPYRFALRHLYGLSAVETDPAELDPAAFGNLVHAVLQDFGESIHKDETNASAIAAFCSQRLDHHVEALTFGAPTAAVVIQAEQARDRLRSFALAQAAHRGEGFRIERVEQRVEALDVFGGITLVGRIDRIDRHDDGRVLLLDYKTSDRAKTPEASHRKRGEWVDLQLPLYRHLAQALGYHPPFLLGYASLPREQASFSLATWTAEVLAGADELAQLCVDRIRLDPLPSAPVSPPPPFADLYAGICQDRAIADDDDEEEGW